MRYRSWALTRHRGGDDCSDLFRRFDKVRSGSGDYCRIPGITRWLQPVAHLGDAQVLVHDVRVDAELPRDVSSRGILVQRFEEADVGFGRLAVPEEAEADELVDAAPGEACELVEVVLGVVLHRPQRAAAVHDRHRLYLSEGVRGEVLGAGREVGDLVLVADEGVEDARLPDVQRMRPTLRRERDLARNAHLATVRVLRATASRGRHPDLRRPATAEARHARLEGGPRELDLHADRGLVPVHGERGAGPRDPVVVTQARSVREGAVGVRRIHDVDFAAGMTALEHGLVERPGGSGAARRELLSGRLLVAVGDQDAGLAAHGLSLPSLRGEAPCPRGPMPVRTPHRRRWRRGPGRARR